MNLKYKQNPNIIYISTPKMKYLGTDLTKYVKIYEYMRKTQNFDEKRKKLNGKILHNHG